MDVSILLTGIKLIDDYKSLQNSVNHLLAFNELAVDIEFDDFNKEIGKKISLIQIFDGKDAYIIDVISIIKKGSKIDLLSKIFNNYNITKVFHSCESDLSFLSKYNLIIHNVIDTNVLYKEITNVKNDISLKNLIKQELNIDLDKTEQKSNWLKRPMTYAQITYAANDVRNLLKLKDILLKKLSEQNKVINTEISAHNQEYKYDKLEKFLDKLCKLYNKDQYYILKKHELSFLINKKIYEKQYLGIVFRNSLIGKHLDELSLILKEIILPMSPKTKELKIFSKKSTELREIKKQILEILIAYNEIYQKYQRKNLRDFAYIGCKIEDPDLWKYLDDNNINREFITEGAVCVLINNIKKSKDDKGAV